MSTSLDTRSFLLLAALASACEARDGNSTAPPTDAATTTAAAASSSDDSTEGSPTSRKQMFDELTWTPLGGTDGSAESAALWGDEDSAHGFLIRAPAGFSIGSHVRPSDTRGFVISGSVVEGLEGASPMEAGTFWVQPGGGLRSTRCETDCLFYVEPEGRWDQLPASAVSESPGGLQAQRIEPADMPWVDAPNTGGAVKLAHVWGDPNDAEPSGFFLFFAGGFPGFPHLHANDYDGVVVQGRPKHWEPGEDGLVAAPRGSHFWQAGGAPHDDNCEGSQDCITYFRFHGQFDIHPTESP